MKGSVDMQILTLSGFPGLWINNQRHWGRYLTAELNRVPLHKDCLRFCEHEVQVAPRQEPAKKINKKKFFFFFFFKTNDLLYFYVNYASLMVHKRAKFPKNSKEITPPPQIIQGWLKYPIGLKKLKLVFYFPQLSVIFSWKRRFFTLLKQYSIYENA